MVEHSPRIIASEQKATYQYFVHATFRTNPTRSSLDVIRQSLACRPVTGPQKLQHRGRTGSSH